MFFYWPRSTMDSIRVSEAPDTGSIPVEATTKTQQAIPGLDIACCLTNN